MKREQEGQENFSDSCVRWTKDAGLFFVSLLLYVTRYKFLNIYTSLIGILFALFNNRYADKDYIKVNILLIKY